MSTDLTIRPLRAWDEMHAVVELQKAYWGDDAESVIPAHMLYSLANFGGHVLTAFVGERPVGVVVGFLGTHVEETNRPAMANLQIVSKRMVVLPEYRNRGIGYLLKRAQRRLAVEQGVRLVVWTFDPLMSRNAHLNVRKLGAVSHTYLENYYGTGAEGGLTTLGFSDRLLVEWWVTSRRVEERLYGSRGDLSLGQYFEAHTPILNPTTMTDDGLILPSASMSEPTGTLALVEIPPDYGALVKANETLARDWRVHTRAAFNRLFNMGFTITDFLHERHEGRERAFYLLSYDGPQFESFRMN